MSIWQTEVWQKMLKKSGQVSDFFEIDQIFIEKRRVALGEYAFFVMGLEKEINNEILEKIQKKSIEENVLFVQYENIDYFDKNNFLKDKILNKGYYKKFITPYTAVIDLNLSEDEILAKMKPKGRYNIRLAIKKGVEVKVVEKTDENIKLFYDLMMETTSRDNFNGNSFDYYKDFLNNLENSKLLVAFFDDIAIASGIFIFEKETSIYYYGASSSQKKYRNLMAPYLLQWKAIKIAKENGSKIYDFLGVAGPDEKDSSLSGVTDFKLKLTPDIRNVSNSYLFVNKKIKYFIINILRKIKK